LSRFIPFGNRLFRDALLGFKNAVKGKHLAALLSQTLDDAPREMKEINLSLYGEEGELAAYAE
jgi:hypothetical protein